MSCLCILQVIIEGFKSFRERTVLDTFHPNLNIIGKDRTSAKFSHGCICFYFRQCRPYKDPKSKWLSYVDLDTV